MSATAAHTLAAPSAIMAAFDARQALAKSDPLLALAYWIEAAGDRRIENDVHAMSILTDMRDRAREAVAKHTGAPFTNPVYPDKAVRS